MVLSSDLLWQLGVPIKGVYNYHRLPLSEVFREAGPVFPKHFDELAKPFYRIQKEYRTPPYANEGRNIRRAARDVQRWQLEGPK